MKHLTIAVIIATLAAPMAYAGPIESACLKSDRKGVNRAVCNCIQQAADLTLTNSEQRKAAKFFNDPHQTQELRQSSKSNDEKLWLRYKEVGNAAQAFCQI